jgi:hypothetical protein
MLLLGGTFSAIDGHELTGVVSGVNALLLIYAVGAFIGWRHSGADLVAQLRRARVRGPTSRSEHRSGRRAPQPDLPLGASHQA